MLEFKTIISDPIQGSEIKRMINSDTSNWYIETNIGIFESNTDYGDVRDDQYYYIEAYLSHYTFIIRKCY